MTTDSGARPLRIDLGALRTFIATVETEIEATLDARRAGLEQTFFPAGRDEQHRHFGRSEHHASAEAIGRSQHTNAAAHLDRLRQVRDGLIVAREAAARLQERYRDADERQEITALALHDIMDDIRTERQLGQ